MSTSNTNDRISVQELIITVLDTVQPTSRLMRTSAPAIMSVFVLAFAAVDTSERYTSNYMSSFHGCPSSAPTPTTQRARGLG